VAVAWILAFGLGTSADPRAHPGYGLTNRRADRGVRLVFYVQQVIGQFQLRRDHPADWAVVGWYAMVAALGAAPRWSRAPVPPGHLGLLLACMGLLSGWSCTLRTAGWFSHARTLMPAAWCATRCGFVRRWATRWRSPVAWRAGDPRHRALQLYPSRR